MTDQHSVDALAGIDPLRQTSNLSLRSAGAAPTWTPPGDADEGGASDPSDAAVGSSAFGAGIDGSGGASEDAAPAPKKKPARKRRARKARSTSREADPNDSPGEDPGEDPSQSEREDSDARGASKAAADGAPEAEDGAEHGDSDEDGGGRKRRRRGSRGGRRRKRQTGEAAVAVDVIPGEDDDLDAAAGARASDDEDPETRSDGEEPEGGRKKRRRRRSRRKSSGDGDADGEAETDDAGPSAADSDEGDGEDAERGGKKKRKRSRSKKKATPAAKTAEQKAAEAVAMRTQTIAVNAVEPEERRVAVFEGDRIVDFLMTAESQKTLVNDIYRGRVVNLEPAIGAAFIDFGQGRNGFLHTSDVLPIYGEDDFEITDLLTAGHHDEEGDHDADWAEEADALDEDRGDDEDQEDDDDAGEEPSADEAALQESGDDEVREDEDEEGDDDDDETEPPRGRRALRSRSRRPASSMVASLDDAERDGDSGGGSEGDSADGDAGSSRASAKKRSTKRKRSRKKAAASDRDGDVAEDEPKKASKKKTQRKKAQRKKAATSKAKTRKASSAKSSKKSSKKKRSAKTSRSRTSRSRGRGERRPQRERRPIDALLKVGDPVVVQVTKDAIGDKGPTLTTYISMPGRYLVLMPSMSRTGVSRKIPDEKERKRLKRILASLKTPTDMGVIVRTAGVGRTKTDLQRDLDYLLGLWESFGKKLESSRGPAPLYLESDVSTRTLRDLFNRSTKEVVVDDLGVYDQMVGFAEQLMPDHVGRIKKHEADRPLFQHVGIEQDFERIFARRVDLPSGGSIVFDQAEALVAIDVNSGRTRTDSYDFEDIALKTNLEAVPEIARQIRLRDLGGIIVCDFIDMMRSSSNRQVERALRTALSDDRARSKLGRISQFGLLEMTRQRLGPGTHKKVFQACPRCRGTGRIRTVESRAQAILRRLGGAVVQKGFTKVEVRAHPEVVQYLKEDLWDWVRALEHRSEKQIDLTAVPDQPEDSVLRYLRADGREVRPGGRRKR
ncbi:MAG: Rne/Rng family ribonuclease [Planctomycetota bacterium]